MSLTAHVRKHLVPSRCCSLETSWDTGQLEAQLEEAAAGVGEMSLEAGSRTLLSALVLLPGLLILDQAAAWCPAALELPILTDCGLSHCEQK